MDYVSLGATLFTPSTYKNIEKLFTLEKYPTLKSLVIDLEDGCENYNNGLENIKKLDFSKRKIPTFLRPKNPESLKNLIDFDVDGFVLPKFGLNNAQKYLQILKNSDFYIMPSIEGAELFDFNKLLQLKEILKNQNVLSIRIGCEDMFRQLNMKKGKYSIFDRSVTSNIIGNMLAIFKPIGFNISGCVYPYFNDIEGFKKDIQREFFEGLFSKTIIHPNQIEPLNELYKVTKKELDEAKEILTSQKVIFNQNGKMAEIKTQTPYAKTIIRRYEVYGLK